MTQPNVLHAWKCLDQVQSQLHCTLEGSVRQLQSPEKFRDASKRLHEVLRDITPLEVEMFDSLERNLLENDDGKGSYMSRIWHALLMLEDELDVIAALGLIEGMCLLRYESKYHFRAKENFQTLLRFLDNPSPPVKLATLHCLEALLVDSAELTRVFERADGVKCVSALVLQPRGGDPQFHYVRLKCVEFLSLYLTVEVGFPDLPSPSPPSSHYIPWEQKTNLVAAHLGKAFVDKLVQTLGMEPGTAAGSQWDLAVAAEPLKKQDLFVANQKGVEQSSNKVSILSVPAIVERKQPMIGNGPRGPRAI